MKLNSCCVVLFLIAHITYSQSTPSAGDFIFPIRPDQENYLAGTMGELRATHFHAGIDIKTSQMTGLPVYASADGYVQRISVSTSGYGNALYLYHPHHQSITVYAHLKSFDKNIAAFVRQKQYEKETFRVNLFPEKEYFRFKQGEVIALSGNTGSSSGPHLHFEIRDKNHKALDPLSFGFSEIIDSTPPVLSKIAFVTMTPTSSVNGVFGRHEVNIIKNKYSFPQLESPVTLLGTIGVEIYAYDLLDGARNKNGIIKQSLVLDKQLVFEQNIEYLDFSKSRNIVVHTNYKRWKQGGKRFNKLYIDNGNTLDFYETNDAKGLIKINDLKIHNLDIRLEDSYHNMSQYELIVNVDSVFSKPEYSNSKPSVDIMNGYLDFQNLVNTSCDTELFVGGDALTTANNNVLDLYEYIPDSIVSCDETLLLNIKSHIPSQQMFSWSGKGVSVDFNHNTLFDSFFLQYQKQIVDDKEYFYFYNEETPFRKNASITLTPSLVYDEEKAAVYSVTKSNKLRYIGGKWIDGEINFKSRMLEKFTIAVDTIPPTIEFRSMKNNSLSFVIKDDRSGINEIRATLNGRWLLMNYESKKNLIWSDEKMDLVGLFNLEISDNSGNKTKFFKKIEENNY